MVGCLSKAQSLGQVQRTAFVVGLVSVGGWPLVDELVFVVGAAFVVE